MKMPILTKCAGINNILDPKRLRTNDRETGLTDLASGTNIDIDDSGQVSCRLGKVLVDAVSSHSLFCDGGDCFVAQNRVSQGDTALYRINSDFTLTGIRSGLVQGSHISYFQVGATTYYTNGAQNGQINNAVSTAWPVSTYYGPVTLKEFSNAPIGTKIAYFKDRAWIAVGNVIYCSEPFKLGLFRLARCFFQFGTGVRLMRPVSTGVWVSDEKTTGFITSGDTWDSYQYAHKSKFPAHEWSDNSRLVDLQDSKWKIPGLSAVWSSDEGLCIGTEAGELIVVTKDRLLYPVGTSGSTVVDKTIAINSVY